MKNDTVKKLKSMRLPAFAEAYEKQIDQEAEYGSMSFHERLMLLVDAEYDSRHNNNIKRLIKNAKFSDCFLASNFPHFHRYDSLKSALYIHAVSKNINTFPKNQGRIRAAIAVEILDFTVMYR